MINFIQYFIGIIIGYVIVGLFQYRISEFFYVMGMIIGRIRFPFQALSNLFGVTIPSYVRVVYGSLIFVLIFKFLRSTYNSNK